MAYEISALAKEDLCRIYTLGVEKFGEAQADAYFFAFYDRFGIIAESPYQYPEIAHIKAGYRRSLCGSDAIYYRISKGVPQIMRILGRQNETSHL